MGTAERNAKALEIAGRIVANLMSEDRMGGRLFGENTGRNEVVREQSRTEVAAEIADLTTKIARGLVDFI